MRLKQVSVANYCSLEDVTVDCRFLTAMVGPNGAGKSSVLRALELFFGFTKGVTMEDVYNRDPDRTIEITVTFDDIDDAVVDELGVYLDADGTLQVTKAIDLAGARPVESYYGLRPMNPDFDDVRAAPAAQAMKTYNALRKMDEYQDLPSETAKGRAIEHVSAWEEQHADKCPRDRDDGKHFGMGGGNFDISQHIRYLLVPAVRDASDDADGSGTLPSMLSEEAFEQVMAQDEVLKTIADSNAMLADLVRPADNQALAKMQESLNSSLAGLAPNAGLLVQWELGELAPPVLQASIQVEEDGFVTSVGRTGHGVQRAMILAALQHRAVLQSARENEDGTPVPRLVLGIEEPELFQHPNRQRHFAEVLRTVAGGDGRMVADRTQVLIATHSPLFVNLHYFDCVRRLTKRASGDDAPATRIHQKALDEVAHQLWHVHGADDEPFTGETLRSRLQAVMTPWMNEGFFARKVVLVEGESDRAALLALAEVREVHLERDEIAVIPANGKGNLDRPFLIFSDLGIPTYIMWDGDHRDKPQDQDARINRALRRMVGAEAEDFPEGVHGNHAVHKVKLERTLRDELGDLYQQSMDVAKEAFGYDRNDEVLKSPAAMEAAMRHALDEGGELDFLSKVLDQILGIEEPHAYVVD